MENPPSRAAAERILRYGAYVLSATGADERTSGIGETFRPAQEQVREANAAWVLSKEGTMAALAIRERTDREADLLVAEVHDMTLARSERDRKSAAYRKVFPQGGFSDITRGTLDHQDAATAQIAQALTERNDEAFQPFRLPGEQAI